MEYIKAYLEIGSTFCREVFENEDGEREIIWEETFECEEEEEDVDEGKNAEADAICTEEVEGSKTVDRRSNTGLSTGTEQLDAMHTTSYLK